MEDPESASAEALRMLEDIQRGWLDPIANFEALRKGIEAAWDGPLSNIPIAHEALMKAEIAFYDAQRNLEFGSAEQILFLAQTQELLARSWHRKPNPKQAFMIAYAVIRRLEDIAGGRPALIEIIGRPTPSALAEATVEVLGIYIAALRRVESHPEQSFRSGVEADLYKIGLDLVSSYLGPDLTPRVIYPGTDALAAQWFYRWVHDDATPDVLVDALYDLDEATRPAEKRSEVTAHARDAEYARRKGDMDLAKAEGSAFVSALELLGMIRHLTTIREQGYFAT